MSLIERRRAWAAEHIREMSGGLSIPRYGTAAWGRLGDDDPLKLASVLRAAELWATDGDDLTVAAMIADAQVVGEPMLIDEDYQKFSKGIVQSLDRAQTAYKARAESGDKAAVAALERLNDKAWLQEESVYARVMRERQEASE